MRRLFWVFGLGALLVGLPLEARAFQSDDPQFEEPATVLDDLEVWGGLTPEALRRRVEEFTAGTFDPPVRRQLARWNRPVCIGAANFTPEIGQALIDHIARHLVTIGGEVQEPGCRVNLMLIGTDDGAATAASLVKENPRGFRPGRSGTDRGAVALQSFIDGKEPVKWWHVSFTVSSSTGELAANIGYGAPTNVVTGFSRYRSNVQEDLMRAYVIIDTSQMPSGVRLRALADYIAFVSLAQVDPLADTGSYDSVLNLFDQPGEVDGMTQFDQDFLAGLYQARVNTKTTYAQTRAIASQMLVNRRRR